MFHGLYKDLQKSLTFKDILDQSKSSNPTMGRFFCLNNFNIYFGFQTKLFKPNKNETLEYKKTTQLHP